MPVYNPTDANFLSVAQTRTNNGQKDVRVILDISTNIFYTLDDDGNFIEIQSSGGGQDLAGTLAIGNETGGNPIVINKSDFITGDDGFDLSIIQNNTTAQQSGGLIFSENFSYFTSTLYSKDDSTGDTMKVLCDLGEAKFLSPNGSILQVSDLGGLNYNKAWTNVLFSSTLNLTDALQMYDRSYGGMSQFKTTNNTPTLLMKSPGVGQKVCYVEVDVFGFYEQPSPGTITKGFYKKMRAAARRNSSFTLTQMGTSSTIYSESDFSTANADLTCTGSFFQVNVTGETSTDIYWMAHLNFIGV